MTDAQAVNRIRELSGPLAPLPTGVPPRLGRLEGIRAVLFDVYGTLLVSASGEVGSAGQPGMPEGRAAEADSLVASLREVGCEPRPLGRPGAELLGRLVEAHQARARARGIVHPEVDIVEVFRDLAAGLAGAGLVPSALPGDRKALERLALEYECRVNPTATMPGATYLLRELDRTGRILGIVSNAQFITPLAVEAHLGASPEGLGMDPELCLWSWQLGEAKPSTRLHRMAARILAAKWGISPGQTIYVGNDMRNDIFTASEAGMRTALFAGDARSYRPRLDDARFGALRPDLVLAELPQLLQACG